MNYHGISLSDQRNQVRHQRMGRDDICMLRRPCHLSNFGLFELVHLVACHDRI